MTCAQCGGLLVSRPMQGRHTGLWFSTCRACFTTQSSAERPDFVEPEVPAIRHHQAAPPLEYAPKVNSEPMVRVGKITPQELEHINARDLKLKASGE